MTRYTWFIIVFSLFALLITALGVRSLAQLRVVLRVAVSMVLLGYPWDHFAITWHVWDHPDPGPRLYLVPVNDLIFIFAATLVTATLLSSPSLFRLRAPERKPEGEGDSDYSPDRESP